MKTKVKKSKSDAFQFKKEFKNDFEKDGQRRKKLKPMPKGKFNWRQLQEE